MTDIISDTTEIRGGSFRRRLYGKLLIMTLGAMIASAGIIVYSSQLASPESEAVYNRIELAASMFLPYMVSAAVAAITAIAILTIMPMGKAYHKLEIIRLRLQGLATGDLSSRVQVTTESPEVKLMAGDLNTTVTALGNKIAQWKIINRQQWDILEHIRHAATRGDTKGVLQYVDRMSKNWERIAEIEQTLTT